MSTPATPTESKTPRQIGREMARLREQFNLTPQEVAERIHIRPRYITAMEEARYDILPGKVYARGYIQTYADFLGMNPEKTIEQCFAGEAAPNAQPVPPPAATLATLPTTMPPYGRVVAVVAVLAFAVIVLFSQMQSTDNAASDPAISSVAPVPESMLASMRTLVMPTADNYECLTRELPLSCFYSHATNHLLSQLTRSNRLPFVGEIDVSEWTVIPEAAPEMIQKTTIIRESASKPAVVESPAASEVSIPEENAPPAVEATPEEAGND